MPSPDGIARIPYQIYPKTISMPEDRAIAAIKASLATWEAWNPKVRFVYQGVSLTPPVSTFASTDIPDGRTVFGFGAAPPGSGYVTIYTSGRWIVEASMVLGESLDYFWRPCPQRDGACTEPMPAHYEVGATGTTVDGIGGGWDLQALVTHEAGHVLNLGDMPQYCQLTMTSGIEFTPQPAACPGRTALQTLALGDVLGTKFLYPWRCPRLPEGVPNRRASYPRAWRHLCPTIEIFAP